MSRRSLALLAAVVLVAVGLGWLALRTAPIATVADDPTPVASAATAPTSAPAADLATPGPAASKSAAADERTAAEVGAQAANKDAFADALWVEGLVRFPSGTPRDDRTFVHARGRKLGDAQEHRFEVGADGRFRAAFAPATRKGWLRIEGRFLFTATSLQLDPSAPPESIVLEPKVGGCLRLNLVPSRLALPRAAEFASARGFAHGQTNEVGVPLQRGSRAETGALEFWGLDPEVSWYVNVELADFNVNPVHSLRVEPGKVLEREGEVTLAAQLSGVVRDQAGVPVDGASIQVQVKHGAGGRMNMPETTKDGGKFSVSSSAGTLTLTAQKKGYVETQVPPIEASEGFERSGIEIVLDSGLVVTGVVRWPDGTPAAKAIVEGSWERTGRLSFGNDGPQASTRAESDGTFRLTGLEAGPLTVSARAKREAGPEKKADRVDWTARRDDVGAGTVGLELVLGVGNALRGRVVDDVGAALETFRVRAEPVEPDAAGRRAVSANSSESGSFEIPSLPDGMWELVAALKDGRESGRVQVDMPRDAAREVTLVLPRPARISGRVVDPDGQARADARVLVVDKARRETFYRDDDGPERCDADGRFAFDVAPSAVSIHAQSTGTASSLAIERDLAAGQVVDGLTLVLRRGGTIEGLVRDREDRPRAGKVVYVNTMRSSGDVEPLTTAADGSFRAERVTPGRVFLSVMEDGRSDGDSQAQVDVKDGEVVRVQIGGRPKGTLVVTGTVRGKVPLAGARVSFFAQKSSLDTKDRNRTTRTDENGRYEIVLAAAGQYSVNASPEGFASIHRSIEIADTPGTVVDFDLPAGRIAGRVVGPEGKPVAKISVQLGTTGRTKDVPRSQGWQQTSADGGFAFEGVAAGTYQLKTNMNQMFVDGRARKPLADAVLGGIELAQDGVREGLELRLSEGATVLARVLAPDGRPAAGAIVKWSVERDSETVMSDSAGIARLEGLPTGEAKLFARTTSATVARGTTLSVRAGETIETTLQLVPGTVLVVRLFDRTGQAVADPSRLFVSVTDAQGVVWDQDWSESHAIGARQYGPLPDGDFEVKVLFGPKDVRRTVHVAGGTTREFEVREPE